MANESSGKKALKAGLGYTVGNMLVKGLSFLAIPLFARLMTVEDFGIYSTFSSYVMIMTVLAGFTLHTSVRNAKLDYVDLTGSYCSSVTLLVIGNSLLLLALSLVFAAPLARSLSLEQPYLPALIVLESFGMAMLTFYNSVLSVDYKYKEYLVLSLVYAVAGIGGSVLLILTLCRGQGYLGRILGTLIPAVLVGIYVVFRLWRKDRPRISREYWRYGMAISLPTVPHGLSQLLLNQFDRIMIKSIIGSTEAGLYSFAYNVGMIFQNFSLFQQRTVLRNVTFPLELHKGYNKAEARERALELLELVGLADKANKYPSQLSGGQQQRCALARILVGQPELVLLDEPFSALDAYLKWQVELELSDILKNLSCGTLFVTHNRDEVYRLCDTVSCMNRGKMEVMEPLKEFFQNPKTRTAAILSGCKNISAAERVDAHTLRAVDWGVTLHVKEREIADDIRAVGIRAHFLATVERPGEENVFPVNESEIWEDPFEWNISFRKNAECSWLQWKIAKTDWSPEMGIPKELYLKEEDILLLTDS